jgi:hypothetical protein
MGLFYISNWYNKVFPGGNCFKVRRYKYNFGVSVTNAGAKKYPDGKRRGKMNMAPTYSPTLLCSTIGHKGLNFSVRNGKR